MAKKDKERKQDLGGPDEEALEQRVREMLDLNEPDPVAEEPKKPEKPAAKGVAINVVHHEEEEKAELTDAIEAANEQLAQATTAPELPGAGKKVVIKHFDDDEKTLAEIPPKEEVKPVEAIEETPETEPEAATEPVIETATETSDAEETTAEPTPEAEDKESPLEDSIESVETEQAVSDIVASESDELLAMHDDEQPVLSEPKTKPTKSGFGAFLGALFSSPGFRWTLFLLLFGGLVTASLIPTSRYFLLNQAGVRSSASIVIIDRSTTRPLKNVAVTIAGQTVQTDIEGKAQFNKLKLGPTRLLVEKRAFSAVNQQLTIGWGSNPLQSIAMNPVGDQRTFIVTDFLSKKPIADVEAIYGEANAISDAEGKIKLTIDRSEEQKTIQITIKANGYRTAMAELDLSKKQDTPVSLVPSHKVIFVSKRTGKYDVYKIDADGQNESLVLAGTGLENESLVLAPHSTDDAAMLISSRSGKYTSDGKLQLSLMYINTKDNSTKTVTESSEIRAVDWIGSRFIYVQLNNAVGAEDPSRYRLMSYDTVSGDNRQLATTNYFNSVISAGGKIYYAPSSTYQNGVNIGVFTVQANGNGKRAILDQEAWNLLRTSYAQLTLPVQQDWYQYKLGSDKSDKLPGQPTYTNSRVYSDSPDGKRSVWLDNRDGKGTLILVDTASGSESTPLSLNGLKGPVRWLNNTTLVYRLVTSGESADYVLNIEGGTPRKVSNVSNVSGIDRWAY